MYLSAPERQEIMTIYGCKDFTEQGHYQVEPDTWVYLFNDANDKKYILISTDYLDFDFDTFPHLLKFNNHEFNQLEFVLQRELPLKDNSLIEKAADTILFEYTDPSSP